VFLLLETDTKSVNIEPLFNANQTEKEKKKREEYLDSNFKQSDKELRHNQCLDIIL